MPNNDLSLKSEQVARNKTDIILVVVENLFILFTWKLFIFPLCSKPQFLN